MKEIAMQTVFIAGATGYLGRYLCAEYQQRGWHVTALVRNAKRAGELSADTLVEAQATRPEELEGIMDGADLVVSALGITRQADGLSYRDVDFQANLNLLRAAEQSQVARFAYIHMINAERMRHVPLVAAKADFVDALRASEIASTVIAPTGYFSDMGDFLKMARAGRVWLFGDGDRQINPIHGADLAKATADATEDGKHWLDVGGPEIFTHDEIAQLAFAALGREARLTHLPDALRRGALRLLPWLTPRRIRGPAQFFLSAMAMDMVGERRGHRRLSEYFSECARNA